VDGTSIDHPRGPDGPTDFVLARRPPLKINSDDAAASSSGSDSDSLDQDRDRGGAGRLGARTGAAAHFFEPIAGIRPPLCRGFRAGASSSPARHGRRRSSRAGCGRCKRRSTASSRGPVPLPQARKSRSSSSLIRPRFGNESTNRWWPCGIRTRRAMRPQHGASACARSSAGAACAFADERSPNSASSATHAPLLANSGSFAVDRGGTRFAHGR
jgi:hypothetical protein